MALHLSCSAALISSSEPTRYTIHRIQSPRRIGLGLSYLKGTCNNGVVDSKLLRKSVRLKCGVKASLDATVGVQTENLVGKVTQVNKDTFWPVVNAAQDKTVVLDMFTQWCGPCKVMAPKFEKLAEEKLDVIFLKLDCNQENKALAKELAIRVVPTFKILKDSKIVKEVTGAKYDELVEAIEKCRSGSS